MVLKELLKTKELLKMLRGDSVSKSTALKVRWKYAGDREAYNTAFGCLVLFN